MKTKTIFSRIKEPLIYIILVAAFGLIASLANRDVKERQNINTSLVTSDGGQNTGSRSGITQKQINL